MRHIQLQMLSVLKVLLRDYAEAHDLDTDGLARVELESFHAWVLPRRDELLSAREAELTQQLQLSPGLVSALRESLDSPWTTCQALLPIWPAAVLSGRPPLKDPPSRIGIVMAAGWADGREARLDGATGWRDGDIVTDGDVVATLRQMALAMVSRVGGMGVAAWLDAAPGQSRADLRPPSGGA